jgi:hypothetical protein
MFVQNGVPDELSTPGIEWFKANNLTNLAELLVNPLALYGYGDINVVPAVRSRACIYLGYLARMD